VSLNKKEALAFVRAVRKFGTTERMDDIVAEAGPHVGEELDSAAHIVRPHPSFFSRNRCHDMQPGCPFRGWHVWG
jgi:hypothetical protein